MIEGLEKLLAQGKDSPELRFGLGRAYLERQDWDQARLHLEACLEQKADYSAAWKMLGQVCRSQADTAAAERAWQRGIEVAEKQGDKQAAKEMQVFLKRLHKT